MERNVYDNPTKWTWVMKKLANPLSISCIAKKITKLEQPFGYPQKISGYWYDNGNIYFDKEEIELVKRFLHYKTMNNPDYPDVIAKGIFNLSKQIKQQEIEIPLDISVTDLVKLFEEKQEFFLKMIGHMSFQGSVEMGDVLSELIKTILSYKLAEVNKLSLFQEYLDSLSAPLYQSIIVEEKEFVLQKSIGFCKLDEKEKSNRVKDYLNKYTWLSFHWFVGNTPTEEEVRKRFEKLSTNAEIEIKEIKERISEDEKKIDQIIHKLNFNEKEKKVVNQYRMWLYLRTSVKDNINLAGYKLLPILYEIAKRIEIEKENILCLTLDEILNIENLSKKEIEQKINERKNGFSGGISENKFKIKEFIKPEENIDVTQKVKGQVAYKGIVRGKVKIVCSPKEQHKLEKGEILVTHMTTPDFLPCMERAAAFITDEGGITCHAAIVAREMKKPCIMGTRYGTSLLRDGDYVEVDAEQGIVKIINHNY